MTTAEKTAAAAVRKLLPRIPDTAAEMRDVVSEAAQTAYKIDQFEARKSADIAAVTKVYGGEIATLTKKLAHLVGGLKAWATKHRERFGDKQRLLVDDHALRFQRSPGALKHPDKPDEQVDAILASGDEELIAAAISLKPAPDKVTIKALLEEGGDLADRLSAMGYTIDKPEAFDFVPAAHKTDTTVLTAK